MFFCFLQVCQPHDYANPMTVKNHNELLRCFAVLGSVTILSLSFCKFCILCHLPKHCSLIAKVKYDATCQNHSLLA